LESFQAQVGPSLPEGSVVSSQKWKTYVYVFGEAIGWSFFDHFVFVGINYSVMTRFAFLFFFFSLIVQFWNLGIERGLDID
jgi:hypothetical protein